MASAKDEYGDWVVEGGMEDWMGTLGAPLSDDPLAQQRSGLRAYRDVLEDVPTLGMRALSSDAARSQAAAMGQAGAMPIGGGSAASLRQTGLDTGRAKAGFLAEALPAAELARSEAGQQLAQIGIDEGGYVRDAQNQAAVIVDLHFKKKGGSKGLLGLGIGALGAKKAKVSSADFRAGIEKLQALASTAPTQAARNVYLAEIVRQTGATNPNLNFGLA